MTIKIIALDSIQQFPHFCVMFIYIVEPVHVPNMREIVEIANNATINSSYYICNIVVDSNELNPVTTKILPL